MYFKDESTRQASAAGHPAEGFVTIRADRLRVQSPLGSANPLPVGLSYSMTHITTEVRSTIWLGNAFGMTGLLNPKLSECCWCFAMCFGVLPYAIGFCIAIIQNTSCLS